MKRFLTLVVFLTTTLFAENTKGYPVLTMSKDDGMCRHFFEIFYDDMHRHNGYMPELHKEFTDVPWKKADVSSRSHIMNDVKTAQIDINNDGKKEFVFFRDYSAYAGKYWYEQIESIQWFDLTKSELVQSKIDEQNGLMDQLGKPMQFVQTFHSFLEMKELPKIDVKMGDLHLTSYQNINLDYEGLRIAKYKEKYYLVFFGLNHFIDYNPKSKVDKKIKDKTIIVISRYTPKNERQDVCYYFTVK